ncbi:MAG: hypothetical protein IIB73_11335 [Proteobacteria bacterium]|nr:hypothetical protein [Pseudomonadota bacterium]
MKTLAQLKEELEMNRSLTELMDVLKGIAAAEFWTLAKGRKRFTEFIGAFEGFFQFLDFIEPMIKRRGQI